MFSFLLDNVIFPLWISRYTTLLQQVSAGPSTPHGNQTVITSLHCLAVNHTLMSLETMGINLFGADHRFNSSFLPVELKDGTGNPRLHLTDRLQPCREFLLTYTTGVPWACAAPLSSKPCLSPALFKLPEQQLGVIMGTSVKFPLCYMAEFLRRKEQLEHLEITEM